MIQKHKSKIKTNEESPILMYPNGIKNRISFKIKTDEIQLMKHRNY